MNAEIRYKLAKFTESFGSGYYPDALYDKADYTLSLFAFFADSKTPEILHVEANKLSAQLPSLRVLERMLRAVEKIGDKNIRFEPELHGHEHIGTLTLSPEIHISSDDSKLLDAVEALRKVLAAEPVRYDLLINFIVQRAAQEGYLETMPGSTLWKARF